jgi:hypothetical protein
MMLAKLLSGAALAGIAVIAPVVIGTRVVIAVVRLARQEGLGRARTTSEAGSRVTLRHPSEASMASSTS